MDIYAIIGIFIHFPHPLNFNCYEIHYTFRVGVLPNLMCRKSTMWKRTNASSIGIFIARIMAWLYIAFFFIRQNHQSRYWHSGNKLHRISILAGLFCWFCAAYENCSIHCNSSAENVIFSISTTICRFLCCIFQIIFERVFLPAKNLPNEKPLKNGTIRSCN